MSGMSIDEWKRKIGVGERQVNYGQHAGTSRDVPIMREDTGQLGGKHTQHWDGRQDATIIAPTITKNLHTGESTVSQ